MSSVAKEYPARSGVGEHKSVRVYEAYLDWMGQHESGGAADPEAYCARYPELRSSLERYIRAHLALEEEAIAWPRAGEEFLGYRLLHPLGAGALGRVFLANEIMLNRLVAVKIARQGWDEAGIVGSIQHPHVVPVHSIQVDLESGLTVVCMPYLGSATLCDVLDKMRTEKARAAGGRLIIDAVREAALPHEGDPQLVPPAILRRGTYGDAIRHLGAQLADALAFIHERGIVHRDLKPSNVLLTWACAPVLLDFNVAVDVKHGTSIVGGTLPYMAPEQLWQLMHGDGHTPLDGRADIYSLGVILYELLTAAHPLGPLPLTLTADELAAMLQERQPAGPRPLREIRPDIDRSLADLVESCLAYDPADRPQAAAEIAAALQRDVKPVRRAARLLRRHPRRLAVALLLFVAMCAGAAYLWLSRPPYSQRQYQQGLALYRQGAYREAVQCFSEVLDAEPKSAEALFARGRTYQKLAETETHYYNLAIGDFELADTIASQGRNKACIGYCFSRLGQPATAITHFELAVRAGFAPAEVFNDLGYFQLKVQRLEQAKNSLDHALMLNPTMQVAFHNRARVWLEKARQLRTSGKARQALAAAERGIADIQQALALGPAAPNVYRDAAWLCAHAANSKPRWIQPGLEYIEKAVSQGHDPRVLYAARIFAPLRNTPQFQALATRPRPPHPPPVSLLFVDPVQETSD